LARILILDGHSAAALAVTRSAGRLGHWIAVGTNDGSFAPAAVSRYCSSSFTYPVSTENEFAFLEAVLNFVRANGIELVIPITEWTTLPLARHRAEIEPLARLALPSLESLERAADKLRTIQIASDLGGTFHNFTRLDIAVDGGKFFETHERMKAKEIVLIGRAAVNDYYIRKKGSPDRVINGYYIGSRKSSKSIKVYNKTNELTRSNKRYIENYWKQNNIDTSRDVQRMELTMRNDESKKYDDIDWNKLDQPSHLASIMRSNMSKFAEYRIPHGKNSARWPKVEMINWNQLCGETLPKNSTMPSNEVWSAKVTCKKLFEIHYISSDQQFFDVAYEIAINTDIVDWFTKMQPYWIKDLETKARSVGGDLEALPWKYHFKRYHAGEKILMFEP